MKLKSIITSMMRKAVSLKMSRYYKRAYGSMMTANGIPDKKVAGEDEWTRRWAVLGKADPMYYRFFSHYIGQDMDIVPENLCVNVIEKCLNPGRYVPYYSDKNMFDRLFPSGTCPVTLLRKIAGACYSDDYSFIRIEDDGMLFDVLDKSLTDVICIKPSVDTGSGVGVSFYRRNDGIWTDMLSGKSLSLDFLCRRYKDDFIIQEGLKQSDDMAFYNPTSVNTLRLTLYRSVKTDECVVPSAIMRIGGKGSLLDNAHAGGAFIGIREDGRLCNKVLDQYGKSDTVFNDIDFSVERRIKDWDKVVSFAKEIGSRVPHMRLLALDIMIDSEGNPRLIEFNCCNYSMWLFQFTTHGAFGMYTEEIIEYCKGRKDDVRLFVKL